MTVHNSQFFNQLVLKRDTEKWTQLIVSISKLDLDPQTNEAIAFNQLSQAFKNRFNKTANERWIGEIKNNLNKYASDCHRQNLLKEFADICAVWLVKSENEFNIFKMALEDAGQKTAEKKKPSNHADTSSINPILLRRDVDKFRSLCFIINRGFDLLDVSDQSAFEILSKYYQRHFDKHECEELLNCLKGNLNKYSAKRELQTNMKEFVAICTLWYTKTEPEFAAFKKAMGGKEKKPIVIEEHKQKETNKRDNRINFSDGSYYIGEILYGSPHGKGKYFWKNGNWHEGDWKNGVQSGNGTFYSIEYRRTDTGTYKDGKRYGKGKMTWADGSWYEGGWNENGRHGKGRDYTVEAKRTDIGDFVNDVRDGYGIMKWEDGDRYEGTWKDTASGIQGEGVYYYSNGHKEEGRLVNGKWMKSSHSSVHSSHNRNDKSASGWIRSHKLATVLLVFAFVVLASNLVKLFKKDQYKPPIETVTQQANYFVTTQTLNIRERPNAHSSKTGQLKYGDKLRVEEYNTRATGFAKINHQGLVGYVSNKYLRPISGSAQTAETGEANRVEKLNPEPATESNTDLHQDHPKVEERQMEEEKPQTKSTTERLAHVRGEEEEDGLIREQAEQKPVFPGGGDALFRFLRQNLSYPTIAAENGIQGRVLLRFIIHNTGRISNITVVNSLDPACDNEAIRVVRSMPRWNPGRQDGKPVSVYYMLPVVFSLN